MGAVFLDCSKCHERIPITALYRAAVADGFPGIGQSGMLTVPSLQVHQGGRSCGGGRKCPEEW
eukprot:11310663-Heterocapsa_arctica.AAC.1